MAFFGLTQRKRETRRAPRYDVDYLAHIDLHDDSPPIHCIICDISAHGARLTVGPRFEIPDEVTLTFRRRCRVVRREDGQIGVEFVVNSGTAKLEPATHNGAGHGAAAADAADAGEAEPKDRNGAGAAAEFG